MVFGFWSLVFGYSFSKVKLFFIAKYYLVKMNLLCFKKPKAKNQKPKTKN
jgi:hypothetical protein